MRINLRSSCAIICALCVTAASAFSQGFGGYTEKIPRTLVTFDMIAIPEGSIGIPGKGEAAKKTVKVKRFWIGKTEVRFDELDVFRLALDVSEDDNERLRVLETLITAHTRPTKPFSDPSWGFGHHGHPALSVTYYHANEYCKWLSKITGRKYRLPTEEEWEYACRAGDGPRELTPQQLNEVAWWRENSHTDDQPLGTTHPVGTKAPNAWGLHDMLGNVWEWTTGPNGKPVPMGGAWNSRAAQVQCGSRFTRIELWSITDCQVPKSKWWHIDGNCIGFRVVREE